MSLHTCWRTSIHNPEIEEKTLVDLSSFSPQCSWTLYLLVIKHGNETSPNSRWCSILRLIYSGLPIAMFDYWRVTLPFVLLQNRLNWLLHVSSPCENHAKHIDKLWQQSVLILWNWHRPTICYHRTVLMNKNYHLVLTQGNGTSPNLWPFMDRKPSIPEKRSKPQQNPQKQQPFKTVPQNINLNTTPFQK